jgi:hypothetical protein
MIKIIKFVIAAVVSLILVSWAALITVRHVDGDIIFTSDHGWKPPHVRQVRYFLPRADSITEIKAQGYWFGGDVLYEGAPKWVLLLPCPKWIGSVGGNWYGSIHGYLRWVPSI